MFWTIGEIGCGLPFGPVGMIASRIEGRLEASSALISKLAGSGLVWSCWTMVLSFSSLLNVASAWLLLMKVTEATWGIPSSFVFSAEISAGVASS